MALQVRSEHSAVALPCRTGLRAVLQDSKFPVPLRERVLSPSEAVSCKLTGRHGSSTTSLLLCVCVVVNTLSGQWKSGFTCSECF